MAGNRKNAEALIINYIYKLTGSAENKQMYIDKFTAMNDKEFDQFMSDLENDKTILAVIIPNLSNKTNVSMENNFKLAKELGHDFYERVWLPVEGENGKMYLSPKKYLIVDLPLRRQAQVLEKKISIPEDNKSIDDFTGQTTGKIKGAKISYPELQILAALDLNKTSLELMKCRGGDLKGFNAMNDSIAKTGGVSQDSLEALNTRVKSTDTLHVLLTSMHVSTTLNQR